MFLFCRSFGPALPYFYVKKNWSWHQSVTTWGSRSLDPLLWFRRLAWVAPCSFTTVGGLGRDTFSFSLWWTTTATGVSRMLETRSCNRPIGFNTLVSVGLVVFVGPGGEQTQQLRNVSYRNAEQIKYSLFNCPPSPLNRQRGSSGSLTG